MVAVSKCLAVAAVLLSLGTPLVWAGSQPNPASPAAADITFTGLAGPMPLTQAAKMASAILLVSKGEVAAAGPVKQVTFHVEQVLAGANPGNATIALDAPYHHLLQDTEKALLLLDADGLPVDPRTPFFPLGPRASAVIPAPDRMAAIGRCLVASLAPDTPALVLEKCVRAVGDLDAAEAAEALCRLSESQDPVKSGWGLVGLVGLGDRRAFPRATQYLLDSGQVRTPVARYLSAKIGSCAKAPALAQYVTPLLSSPDSGVRQDALRAVWQMGQSIATPHLVQALSDTDTRVRFTAIMALSDFFWQERNRHRLPAPLFDIFRADPDRYTRPWRDWWEREGKAKYGQGAGE